MSPNELLNVKPQDVPLKMKSLNIPANALPRITDDNITKAYQSIVGSLLYLVSWTCPDIVYAVMALTQWNASPTISTLLTAKGCFIICWRPGTGCRSMGMVFIQTALLSATRIGLLTRTIAEAYPVLLSTFWTGIVV